jgi:hypothetical protein
VADDQPYVEVCELEPGTPEYEASARFEQRGAELGTQSYPVGAGPRGWSLGYWLTKYGGDTVRVDLPDGGTRAVSLERWSGRDPETTFISIRIHPAGRPA